MSQNAAKNLETYINKSTDEKAMHPDSQMFLEICNIINSRSDMPKLAIQLIRKRISAKNPKTVYLCLELLEVAANACELPFHNQVASKDFMLVLNSLVSKEIDKTVFEKLLHLVKYWTQLFEGSKDILPGFFEFYQSLEKKGAEFPKYVESKYAYLLKNKPKPNTSSRSDEIEYKGSYAGNKSEYIESRSSSSKTSSKGLTSKLKKDFELVRENINLTNDLIDNHELREDVSKNDVLTDLIQTLRTMENKLIEFVQKQNDEETLKYCLELNDDLNKTLERYKTLRKASMNEVSQQEVVTKSKKMEKTEFNDISFKPSTNTNNTQKSTKMVNLFDDDLMDQPQQSQPEPKKQQNNGGFGGFDDFSGGSTNTSNKPKQTTNSFDDFGSFNNQPQTTSNTTTTTNTTENLADKINSLYKNPDANKVNKVDQWDILSTVTTNNAGGNNQNIGWGGNVGGGGFNTGGYGGNQNIGGGFNNGGSNNNAGGFGGYGNQGGYGGQGGFGGGQGGQGGQGGFGGNQGGFGGNQGGYGGQGGFGGNQGGFGGNQGGFGGNQGGFGGNQGGFSTQPVYGGGNTSSWGGNSNANTNTNSWGGNTGGGYGNSGNSGNTGGFSTQQVSTGTKSSNPFDLSDLGTNLEDKKKVQTNKNLFDDLM